MKITESQLRRIIRHELRSLDEAIVDGTWVEDYNHPLPPPDEPNVEPNKALGQYVLPDQRIGRRYSNIPEPYTKLENELENALERHYYDEQSGSLKRIWPRLMSLKRKGLYADLLNPPPGSVYRLLTVDHDRASSILGVEPQDITAQTNIAQAAPNPPTYVSRKFISSWTLDPRLMVSSNPGPWAEPRAGSATVILMADTSQGEFLINPHTYAAGWLVGQAHQDESEVIGGGSIPLVSAAWLWHGDAQEPLAPMQILDALLDAIGE